MAKRKMDPTYTTIQDNIRGMALGSAIGDALGMPLEFKQPPMIPVVKMIQGRLGAGFFTDDTEMALALADAYLANRLRFDAKDTARRWIIWLRQHPADAGVHTSGILGYLSAVLDIADDLYRAAREYQARDPDSAGSGSIMRMWPAVAVNWRNQSLAILESVDQGRLTHPHEECRAATRFLAGLCWKLVQGFEFSHCVKNTLVDTLMPDALRDAIITALTAEGDDRHLFPSSGWVRDTIMTSLWAINVTRDFTEALILAVNQGNDADTTGAVTGMIAGAAWGLSAIPCDWREMVKGRWPIHGPKILTDAELIGYADRLAGF